MFEPKTIGEAVRPLLIINLAWGMGHIDVPQKYLQALVTFVYTVGYVLCILALQKTSIHYLHFFYLFDSINFGNVVTSVLFYFSMSLTVSLTIAGSIKAKELKTIVSLLKKCEQRMENIGLPKHHRVLYLWQLSRFASIGFLILIYMIFNYECEFDSRISIFARILLTFTLNLPMISIAVSDISFCFWIRYSWTKFNQLNTLLRGMLTTTPDSPQHKRVLAMQYDFETRKYNSFRNGRVPVNVGNTNTMRTVKHIHLELIKISRVMNDAYGLQILLTTSASFILITVLLYEAYKIVWIEKFQYTGLQQILPVSGWIIFLALKIFIVNHTCATTTSEAAETGDIICELYEPSTTKEFRAEIRDFTLQMIQNPLVFTACGFFDMDHTFVQGTISSITTYLVILIQVGDIPEPEYTNSTMT